MADIREVNGNEVSWGSFYCKIDGERYYGINSVSYGHGRERAKGYGMDRSQAPSRRSRGKYTTEPLKVRFYKRTADELRRALAAKSPSGTSYGDVEFEAVLQYVEGEGPEAVSGHIEFLRCVYSKVTATIEEGPDLVVEEIEFDVMAIRENGLTLHSPKGD